MPRWLFVVVITLLNNFIIISYFILGGWTHNSFMALLAGLINAVLLIHLCTFVLFPAVVRNRCKPSRTERGKAVSIALGTAVGAALGGAASWEFVVGISVWPDVVNSIWPSLAIHESNWPVLPVIDLGILGILYAALGAVLSGGTAGMKPVHEAEDIAFVTALGIVGIVPGLLSAMTSFQLFTGLSQEVNTAIFACGNIAATFVIAVWPLRDTRSTASPGTPTS
jgi:hypothetical protein